MDTTLYIKIQTKLRAFLNREPNESEIQNGQTDTNLMQWIAQDDALVVAAQHTQSAKDIAALKSKIKL